MSNFFQNLPYKLANFMAGRNGPDALARASLWMGVLFTFLEIVTGLGICFPVILFVSAISALVGMGGGSRAVVRMGEGKLDEANKILGNCTLLLMILGLAATVVFQLCKEPMLYLFGATENTIGYASDYLSIYLWGSISVLLALGLGCVVYLLYHFWGGGQE